MRVARLFLLADWPEKYFSGQSEGGISNASGTRSVRVSAQGLSRSCCKLSPMKIPSSRLAAPGSPRMQANSPFLECQNGCCGNNPCLNGGTCHETCDVNGKRFRCECGPANTGRYCESQGKKLFVHTDLSLNFF